MVLRGVEESRPIEDPSMTRAAVRAVGCAEKGTLEGLILLMHSLDSMVILIDTAIPPCNPNAGPSPVQTPESISISVPISMCNNHMHSTLQLTISS